jgi:septum formation protein
METIILASGSPRRRELLTKVKIPYKVIPPEVPEEHGPNESAADLVARLARRKVEAIQAAFRTESPRWVVGLDTVVEVEGRILGKPTGAEAADEMLRLLSGKVHVVSTGLCLLVDRMKPLAEAVVRTEVKFRLLSDAELRWYVDTGEWTGAAGAYRIQERGAFLVEWIHGSYTNVVGLPLEAFYGILVRNGYSF